MPNTSPSIAQLQRALGIQEQIDKLEGELKSILNGQETTNGLVAVAKSKPGKKKSGMSAEGRARIAAAQKARWAKVKGNTSTPKAAVAPKAKKMRRKMSPEARARIVEAQKKRWAAFKKAK